MKVEGHYPKRIWHKKSRPPMQIAQCPDPKPHPEHTFWLDYIFRRRCPGIKE